MHVIFEWNNTPVWETWELHSLPHPFYMYIVNASLLPAVFWRTCECSSHMLCSNVHTSTRVPFRTNFIDKKSINLYNKDSCNANGIISHCFIRIASVLGRMMMNHCNKSCYAVSYRNSLIFITALKFMQSVGSISS